jgi:16S rRNA (cytosine967-C5)-methyltransferase
LDLAFSRNAGDLDPRDRRWAREAAYGAVRFRGRLDHLLALHLTSPIESLDPGLLEILRLGAQQLLYMDGVPPYAAISQAVEQARALGLDRASGLVNAVLRGLQREGGGMERFPDPTGDPLGHLATWGSHPRWLLRRWLDRWSVEEVRRLVEANNQIPPLSIRPLDGDVQGAVSALEAHGIVVRDVQEEAGTLVLEDSGRLQEALAVTRGQVQDPGAALVVDYADPPSAGWVADLCAAPGGKAVGLASRGARVLATDPSLPRLELLKENALRLDLPLFPVVARAQEPPLAPSARLVLVDVPCSGTGTFRRHPDARWRITPEGIESLTRLQREILEGAGRVVPQGAHLVYSTCTLEPEENERQIQWFLDDNRDFVLDPGGGVPGEFRGEDGYLRVLPQAHGYDGAFAARMKRVR